MAYVSTKSHSARLISTAFLEDKTLTPINPPEMKSYLWEEADILDPSGNRIRIYKAGNARRFPPWRIE